MNSAPVRVKILPGTAFRYSGGGTTLAQLAVTDLLARPLPTIMQDLVLEPLAMQHSTYEQPLPQRLHRNAATAHPWKGEPLAGKWHTYPEMAPAGLWTTPTDLCRVGIELQRAVKGESKLLSKKLAEEMLKRQVGDCGIGFFLQDEGETIRFGHGGWNEGFVSIATFYRDKGMGAVIMINSNEGQPILDEIQRAIAREYQWPDYFEREKKRIDVENAALDRLLGDYETETGLRIVVARDDKDLVLTVGRQPALRLEPYEASKFFAANLEVEVVFDVSGEEPAKGVTLRQDGATVDAKRKTRAPAALGS